jgi:hypothetical protein
MGGGMADIENDTNRLNKSFYRFSFNLWVGRDSRQSNFFALQESIVGTFSRSQPTKVQPEFQPLD